MRPVGNHRFMLPGEKQKEGDLYFLMYALNCSRVSGDKTDYVINFRSSIRISYNWHVLPEIGTVVSSECSIRKEK